MQPKAQSETIDRGARIQALAAAPHLPAKRIIAELETSATVGLSESEAQRRLEHYGPNTIVSRKRVSLFAILIGQFKSPVVYLLSGAAALALYFGEWEEGLAIGAVLAVNALIGFLTEMKARRSIEALRALGTHSARVRRDGQTRLVPAQTLVPGDIVLIEGGDRISADIRLIDASHLGVDESTLTGESVPVDKSAQPSSAGARIAEQTSMLFKGTSVTRGSATGVVVGTGSETELGRVSRLVKSARPEQTPLEQQLERLTGQLVWATAAFTILIGTVGLMTGRDPFLVIEAAIALAVAAIPEGLPIVATLALARGMWRMARQNALIERLSAVETLGATTVILTDKTGTLTENRMTVRRFWIHSGEIDADNGMPNSPGDDPQLRQLLNVAVLCNDATLGRKADEDSGDPMELALLRAARHAGFDQPTLIHSFPIVHKYAFDVTTKMMATVHRQGDVFLFAVKGAPETVLEISERVISTAGDIPMGNEMRRQWLERIEELGHHGLRVLACATKTSTRAEEPPFSGLSFIGLIGLEDPARADVPHAVEACQNAGIRVVMVTGDHAVTARSIGRAVGLSRHPARVAEGRELRQLESEPDGQLFDVDIFARVSPAEKLSLVRAYQAAGAIVAMTGDGVNDAPALRQADIGVAMGLRGTDVAREAAAMILLDDAFPTIIRAIREGRVIFENIRRFIAYLLSCNLSELSVVGIAMLSALPLPLLPLQILYLNLITDVFPAFALAMGEGERNILERPPRDPTRPILDRALWTRIALQSLAMTGSTFTALALSHFWLHLDGKSTVTVTFLSLAFAQLWHVFDMRDPSSHVWHNDITHNPWIWSSLLLCSVLLITPPYFPPTAYILYLAAPNVSMWLVIIGTSLIPLVLGQIIEVLRQSFNRSRAQ